MAKTSLWLATKNGLFQLVSVDAEKIVMNEESGKEFLVLDANEFAIQSNKLVGAKVNNIKLLVELGSFNVFGLGAFEIRKKANDALIELYPTKKSFIEKLNSSMEGFTDHLILNNTLSAKNIEIAKTTGEFFKA